MISFRKLNLVTNLEKYLILTIVILFIVGFFGHFLYKNLFVSLTEGFLLLTTFLVLIGIYFHEKLNNNKQFFRFLVWLLTGFIITYFIEVIGVNTGKVFGYYTYGSVFSWQLFGVPLVIGLNWVMVGLGAILIWQDRVNSYILPWVTGFSAVVFDWFLEKVAILLDYWQWQNNQIPLQNYFAWFWITFWLCIFYQSLTLNIKSRLPIVFFLVQLIWFGLLKFTLAYHPSLEYWMVLVLVLSPTILLTFHPQSSIRPYFYLALKAVIISATPFLIWDTYATYAGHWQFNPKFIEGFYIFNLPVEEIWFFLAVPYSCLYLWSVIRDFESWTKLKRQLINK